MDYICNLPPEVLQKAKDSLGEDENRRIQDLKAIRDWLNKQPHLVARQDAKFLLSCLRGCKFSLEKTKQKLDTMSAMKTALPDFFTGWDPNKPEIQDALKAGGSLPLPGVDQHGRKVFVVRPGAHDPSKQKFEDVYKASFMVGEIACDEYEEIFISGMVLIFDMQGYTLSHFTQLSLPLAKKLMTCWQDGSPLRPQSIHYINMPAVFNQLYNLMQTLMNEKMKKRTKVHTDLDSLSKDISKTVLPKDYGGDNLSLAEAAEFWRKKAVEKRDWLLEQEKYKSDESKRPGKPKTSQELFGMEGSFRKLEID